VEGGNSVHWACTVPGWTAEEESEGASELDGSARVALVGGLGSPTEGLADRSHPQLDRLADAHLEEEVQHAIAGRRYFDRCATTPIEI